MTDRTTSLAAALADLQQNLPHITKDADAQYGKYANLTGVSEKLLPMMGERGLSFSAKATMHDGEFGLLYRLRFAGSDEVDEGFWPLPKGTPQQVGSAITYYRRYLLCSLTGVAPDEDDDDGQAAGDAPPPQRTRTKIPGPDHERLQPRRQPGDRSADRGPVPPSEDLWQDQPPGTFEETPPEERTGSIDGRQRSQIFAKFNLLRKNDAAEQRAILSDILHRPVDSRKGLSYRDAETVLKDLTARVEAKEAAEQAEWAAAEQDAAAEVPAP